MNLLDETHYAEQLGKTLQDLRRQPLPRLDTDSIALRQAFELAFDAGLFAFYRYDPSLHERLKFLLFSSLCACSGSLAFLAIQILAANKIMQANDFVLCEHYFAKRCGIAVNHLRAPSTVVSATFKNGSYRLTGRLSWASGFGIFDTLVAGFHCDGRELQAVIPFTTQNGFSIGDTIETFACNAMNTVDIDLDRYEVNAEQIVAVHQIGTYTRNKSVSKTVHYALYGIGLGAVDAVEDETFKTESAMALQRIKAAFLASKDGDTLDDLRVKLFTLVQQIVTTGMILRGGRSVLTAEPLQRYYRELMMFNANGLNLEMKQRYKTAFQKTLSH